MNAKWTDWYRDLQRLVRMLRRSLRGVLRIYGFKPSKGPTVSQGWVPPDIP